MAREKASINQITHDISIQQTVESNRKCINKHIHRAQATSMTIIQH